MADPKTADLHAAACVGHGRAPAHAPKLSVIAEDDADVAIFQQPWWLEAVSNGTYRTVTAGDGENAFLWLPYVEIQRFGMTVLDMPPLTHTLGPVIRVPDGKPVSQIAHRRKLIEAALAELPPHAGFHQVLAPGTPDAMDYVLNGYEAHLNYTYRIDTGPGLGAVWDGLRDKARNAVRRAEDALAIEDGRTVLEFFQRYDENLRHRGEINQHDMALCARLDAALAARDRHRILVARDRTTGQIGGAVLLIWDTATLYYFRAMHDPAVARGGASSLLLWEAVREAAKRGLTFDSDSFPNRNGALFQEAFGAERAQRITVRHRRARLILAEAVARRFGYAV